jgi:hypothetical protein
MQAPAPALPAGVFPDVWCHRGSIYLAYCGLDGGPLRVYRWREGRLDAPPYLFFEDSAVTTHGFARFGVTADDELVLAYRRDATHGGEIVAIGLTTGERPQWALPCEGNNPCAWRGGQLFVQTRANRVVRAGDFPNEPARLVDIEWRPTGLSRTGALLWDDNRQSEPGMTCPDRAGSMVVGESPTGGVLARLDGREGTLWPGQITFEPKVAQQSDGRYVIATFGANQIRLAGDVTAADLVAVPVPIPTPVPSPAPSPVPTPVPVPTPGGFSMLTAELIANHPARVLLGKGDTPLERRRNALRFSASVAIDANAAGQTGRYGLLAGFGAESDVDTFKADIVVDRQTGEHFDVVVASEGVDAHPGFQNHGAIDLSRWRPVPVHLYFGSTPTPAPVPVPVPVPVPTPTPVPTPGEPTLRDCLAELVTIRAILQKHFKS